jgi:hypothetical protein
MLEPTCRRKPCSVRRGSPEAGRSQTGPTSKTASTSRCSRPPGQTRPQRPRAGFQGVAQRWLRGPATRPSSPTISRGYAVLGPVRGVDRGRMGLKARVPRPLAGRTDAASSTTLLCKPCSGQKLKRSCDGPRWCPSRKPGLSHCIPWSWYCSPLRLPSTPRSLLSERTPTLHCGRSACEASARWYAPSSPPL